MVSCLTSSFTLLSFSVLSASAFPVLTRVVSSGVALVTPASAVVMSQPSLMRCCLMNSVFAVSTLIQKLRTDSSCLCLTVVQVVSLSTCVRLS